MSSFVVGHDHIDYLVSAALAYAADVPGIRERDPQDLGEYFLRENIASAFGREFFEPRSPRGDWVDLTTPMSWTIPADLQIDDVECQFLLDELATHREAYDSYRFRPVEDVDPAQSAVVVSCWSYQRGRASYDDNPISCLLAETIATRALAAGPAACFADSAAPRSAGNLLDRERYGWEWHRPEPRPSP